MVVTSVSLFGGIWWFCPNWSVSFCTTFRDFITTTLPSLQSIKSQKEPTMPTMPSERRESALSLFTSILPSEVKIASALLASEGGTAVTMWVVQLYVSCTISMNHSISICFNDSHWFPFAVSICFSLHLCFISLNCNFGSQKLPRCCCEIMEFLELPIRPTLKVLVGRM